jgi:hypothetical protein
MLTSLSPNSEPASTRCWQPWKARTLPTSLDSDHYLEKLRSVEDERIGLGKEMHRLQAIANSKRSSDVDRVAQAKVVLPHLSGTQELTFHFFAICIHHIRTLLVIASTEVEYTFEEDDVQFLDGYRILRNHYEHWGNRLPGGTNEDMMQIKRELNASTYRVTSQIEVDDQGLFVVYDRRAAGVPVPVHVEVSSGAVKRVERIVETAWLEIRRCALDDIERHLIEHPEEIIEPQQLRVISEVQVGRSIASTN